VSHPTLPVDVGTDEYCSINGGSVSAHRVRRVLLSALAGKYEGSPSRLYVICGLAQAIRFMHLPDRMPSIVKTGLASKVSAHLRV
jgi:hypothetical protein